MFEGKFVFFHLFGFIPVTPISILDIFVVAFISQRVIRLIRGTPAAQILVGMFLVVTLALAATGLEMEALGFLLEQVRSILLIMLVILFQPELRRVLSVIGQSPMLRWFYKTQSTQMVDDVVAGVEQLVALGYGALIVLVRDVGIGAILHTGVEVNARMSADLLTTIFTPRSPLHDQAVVIQGETLLAARCTLPLADDVEDQRLGTRHRAALGLSQECDAVTVVVSEENRSISLAFGGVLAGGLDGRELRQRLVELMTPSRGAQPLTSTIEEDK